MKNIIRDTSNYYDEVAIYYDDEMQSQHNLRVRAKVKKHILNHINGQKIMDFGGGTGLDLRWMLEDDLEVVFCEISPEMRKQAISFVKKNKVTQKVNILSDEDVNFKKWDSTFLKNHQVNLILGNFCVLNSIQNISLLFKQFDQILLPKGQVFLTILNSTPSYLSKYYLLPWIRTILNQNPIETIIKNGDHVAPLFVHRKKELRHAYSPFFNLVDNIVLSEHMVLLHLRKLK